MTWWPGILVTWYWDGWRIKTSLISPHRYHTLNWSSGMDAISRRHWLTWSATACGALALGCRTPGMGELPQFRSFAEPNFSADALAAPEYEEQPTFAAPSENQNSDTLNSDARNEADGVSMTLGDQPATLEWTISYEDALARAGAEGKLVFAFFTGSDFCQPCMRLKQEVFATEAFQAWASERFVLLELDYPRRTAQPADLQAQNRQLLNRYGVKSFPTILVLSPQGEAVGGNSSYRGGGPDAWMSVINDQLARL